MATINRPGLVFPTLKAGDTYPAYEIPDQIADMFPIGSTVLGQIRDPAGLLWYSWPGSLVAGKVVLSAIAADDASRFKSGDYTAEVQVTTAAGVVTTVVHAGKLKVESDNCYPQLTPPLIVPGEGGPIGAGGMTIEFDTFPFDGAGPYETDFVPNGALAVLMLDGWPQPSAPFELTPTGFTLVGISTGYENVSLLYSH